MLCGERQSCHLCRDKDVSKIERLRSGEIPIYEPGLKELADSNTAAGRLSFTDDLTEAMALADVVIIAVGTPPLPNGEADMRFVELVAREIGYALNGYKVVVVKSTVPVGTNERVRGIVAAISDYPFDIASVPEFLRRGLSRQGYFESRPHRYRLGEHACSRGADKPAQAVYRPAH